MSVYNFFLLRLTTYLIVSTTLVCVRVVYVRQILQWTLDVCLT